MNAAFLLLTTAALAGGDPTPGIVPVSCNSCGGSCGTSSSCCDSCCDSGCGGGFFAKLRARCAKHECGCDTCTAPSPVHYHAAPSCCDSGCDSGCGLFAKFRAKHSCTSCDTGCGGGCGTVSSSCDSCGDSCCGGGFLAKLRGRFHKSCCDTGCGCDSGCATGGCATGGCANGGCANGACGATAAPAAPIGIAAPASPAPVVIPKKENGDDEEIKDEPKDAPKDAPKKLPAGKTPPKVGRISPIEPPALEVTPTGATRTEGSKNPFELDRRYQARVARATDYSWLTGQLFYVHADGGIWVLRYAPLSQEDANGGGVVLARNVAMNSYREGDLVTVNGELSKEKGSKYLGAPLYRPASIRLVERATK